MPMPGWGTEPYQTDAALAWVDNASMNPWNVVQLEKSVNETIASWKAWKAKTVRKNSLGLQEERRAAAELIIKESGKSMTFSNAVISSAIDTLLDLLQDKKWLKKWDSESDNTIYSKNILDDIQRQIQELSLIGKKAKTILKEFAVASSARE